LPSTSQCSCRAAISSRHTAGRSSNSVRAGGFKLGHRSVYCIWGIRSNQRQQPKLNFLGRLQVDRATSRFALRCHKGSLLGRGGRQTGRQVVTRHPAITLPARESAAKVRLKYGLVEEASRRACTRPLQLVPRVLRLAHTHGGSSGSDCETGEDDRARLPCSKAWLDDAKETLMSQSICGDL